MAIVATKIEDHKASLPQDKNEIVIHIKDLHTINCYHNGKKYQQIRIDSFREANRGKLVEVIRSEGPTTFRVRLADLQLPVKKGERCISTWKTMSVNPFQGDPELRKVTEASDGNLDIINGIYEVVRYERGKVILNIK